MSTGNTTSQEFATQTEPVAQKKPKNEKLNPDLIKEAVKQLINYWEKIKENQNVLLEDESTISLGVTKFFIGVQSHPKEFAAIELPNSIHKDSDIMIVVSKSLPQARKEMIINADPHIKKVITVRDLINEYTKFEKRKKLSHSYDLFLCEKKVFRRVKGFLGSTFVKNHKVPCPVTLNDEAEIKDSIAKAKNLTYVRRSSGTPWGFPVGSTNLTVAENTQNILAAVKTLVPDYVPGSWGNVRLLFIKMRGTPAIPLYSNYTCGLQPKPTKIENLKK
eukprot:TRINITY_DN6886_c0_g1_i4.p1 TRINITY_DN6886_c0_g1~~TRINITY_DN6886_c0_g1_i4.p1  ORF type:complete len:276 (+),score=33.51 TRINITY_DN6886_c0_g1_i4:83-910(+)